MTVTDTILAYIKANPGCTSNDICAATGMLMQTATAALTDIAASGRVSRQKKGRSFHYIIAKQAAPAPAPVADDGWKQRARELQAKVDELYAWKQDAIAKHPDLQPVDPLVVQARKVVADLYRAKPDADAATDNLARFIEEGHYDGLVEVKAAVAALRTMQGV